MTHSKSYPVTTQVSLPQPHVKYATQTTERMSWSSWLPFIIAGAISLSFMLCLHVFGGPNVFPRAADPYSGMIPIVKQGILKVYPILLSTSNGIESIYSTQLPPRNVSYTVKILENLLQRYPKNHGSIYKNCWLENPSPQSPCFFDVSWITEMCSKNGSYGYEEMDSHYSPCFIMKLENTEGWSPFPESIRNVPLSIADHFDRGFMPVHCFTKDKKKATKITVYPPKGFSLLFFPAAKFDSKYYLPPLVAVKVEGISKGDNVTVECSLVTRNAFMLWNNGKVVVKFTSESSSKPTTQNFFSVGTPSGLATDVL